MPDFRTISQGTAWSDLRGSNTSQRVKHGADRPEAEIRLADRGLEIRTGARVRRARGKWVGFKRGLTKVRSALWMLGSDARRERSIRHAEYKFDRAVNQFVEDLANQRLTTLGVQHRMAKLAQKAARLEKADPTTDSKKVLQRLQTNLAESLHAVSRTYPRAMRNIVGNFRPGGAMHNLPNRVQLNQKSPLAPFIQGAMGIFDRIPAAGTDMVRQKTAGDLNAILAEQLEDNNLHDVADDFNHLPALTKGQLAYVAARMRVFQKTSDSNQIGMDRNQVRTELRLALKAVEIGLPERLSAASQLGPSRSTKAFPADLGLSLGTDRIDRSAELGAMSEHLAGISGAEWKQSQSLDTGAFKGSKLAKSLNELRDADPRQRAVYEEKLGNTLGEVKALIWADPDGVATPSLQRLQAELVIALSQVRLQGLSNTQQVTNALQADAEYDSPVYDTKAARQLASKDRIGANGQYINPFKGMPASEVWKVCMDREYHGQDDSNSGKPFYESGFDRGHNAEPGYMRGMVDALANDVCSNLGKRMTAKDVEALHDSAVRSLNPDKMLRGYRDKMIAMYGVNKFSRDGIKQLDKRLQGHTGKMLSVTERFRLSGKSADQKKDMLKKMNRQEQTDNKPDGMQTWGFMQRDGDYKAYFWPKERAQAMATTDKVLNTYYDEVSKAQTPRDKMRAIVKCCQTLHQLHVFRDGNARTMEMLLLNRLLIEQGMWPAILEDPKAFKGLTVDELVEEVEQGQLLFKIVKSGADMRPPDHIDDPDGTMGKGQAAIL